MASKSDYYEVLGVARDADLNAIKRSYRKLAMQYHPDRNPDDQAAAERFREVTEAYEVLSDKDKRARYDQYGHAGVDAQMQDFWGHGGFQDSHAFRDFGDMFGDVFGDLFGFGGGGGRMSNRGADLRYDLSLSLEEAAAGREVELEIPKQVECETCHGSGARPGTPRGGPPGLVRCTVTARDGGTAGGSPDPYIDTDGLHPSAQGYQKMADLFFTAIQAQLETSAAALQLVRGSLDPRPGLALTIR